MSRLTHWGWLFEELVYSSLYCVVVIASGGEALFALRPVAPLSLDDFSGYLVGGFLGWLGWGFVSGEDLVDPGLHRRIVGSECFFAGFSVAVLAVNDFLGEPLHIHPGNRCRRGCGFATKIGREGLGGWVVGSGAAGRHNVFVSDEFRARITSQQFRNELGDGLLVGLACTRVTFDADRALVVVPVPGVPRGVSFADHASNASCLYHVVGGGSAFPGDEPGDSAVKGRMFLRVVPVVDNDELHSVSAASFGPTRGVFSA